MASTETTYVDPIREFENTLQQNYKGRVQPWLDVISPVAALFEPIGPGEYSLEGKVLVFAADDTYSGGAMATTGDLPASQYVDPVNLQATAARVYVRRMVDNFVVAAAAGEATFENIMDRYMRQMWDAFERTTVRHIHGSSDATICVVDDPAGGMDPVVRDGYGYPGVEPTMFLEQGMWVAALDPTAGYSVKGIGIISTIDRNNDGTAILHFEPPGIPGLVADDVFVFSTSTQTDDDWFQVERGLAPLGLLDLIDPEELADHYLGVPVADHPRIDPIRVESADWGEVEFMEFTTEIASRSNSPVTPESHTFTCQPGVEIELARTLIPFTRIDQKGKELNGGWTAVRIAMQDFLTDPYHIPDVLYALCMEDAYVVPLDGDPRVWDGDGSEYQRLLNFDGKQWWARHYLQRFLNRRNRCGALLDIPNPNANRFVPVPAR